MATRARFPASVLAKFHKGSALRVKAGSAAHRFLGIWVVVIEGRVFVRSWNVKPSGWHQAWLDGFDWPKRRAATLELVPTGKIAAPRRLVARAARRR